MDKGTREETFFSGTTAEVMDIVVAPKHRGRGIGLKLVKHIEKVATERGATLLRSDTGNENVASQRLHEKAGYERYRMMYEKVLTGR